MLCAATLPAAPSCELPVALHNMREAQIQSKYCYNMIHMKTFKDTGSDVTVRNWLYHQQAAVTETVEGRLFIGCWHV